MKLPASSTHAVLAVLAALLAPATAFAEEETGSPSRFVRPPSESHGGIALAASYGVVNGHHAQVVRGLELGATAPAMGKAFVGVVAGFDEGIQTGTGGTFGERRDHTYYDHAYWEGWFGPQLGWGAPFHPAARFGFSIQSGLSGGVRDTKLYSGFGNDDPARYVSGFGAAALRLTLCGCRILRPFAGVSGRWVLAHFGADSVQSASIDLGLALAP